MPSPQPAVLYARVSSEEQEKEGFSIPAQLTLLREYAAREGIEIRHEFVDVETAKKPGRTGFNEMVAFFKKQAKRKQESPRCLTLLVEKTDRLYRNLKDYVTIDELQIDIHFVKEAVVLSPKSHSSEKFMHGIKVLMAKNYVDNLSEETKKGMMEKAKQGMWPLAAPIGYRNVTGDGGKKLIVINPEIAPIIRRLFERYATGRYSLKELLEMARSDGLLSPRSGKPASKAHIHKILCNRFYYGQFTWRGKVYDGSHEPLVSRELWDKVQAILRDRGTKKPKKRKHNFAFSGLITCKHCGCAVVGEIQKGRYVYYHCSGHKQKCPEPYVREEVLEAKFTGILSSLAFDAEILDWTRQAIQLSHVDEKAHHEKAIRRLQAEYNRLQKRIEAAYEDKLDGRIDIAFFDRKTDEWREDQARCRDAIEAHEQANQNYLCEGIALVELANRAAELFEKQPPREKRKLLDFLLSNCSWGDGVLTPTFRQPFDMIADASTQCAEEKAAGGSSDDLRQLMGG
jgi:DNA invertase Pin-like site-specific DNA recombinase